MLRLADVKSWKTFVKGSISLDVGLESALVTLTPMKNLGSVEGFEPDNSRDVAVKADAEAIGSAVRALLDSMRQHRF
jgi:hypothetical protein